MARPQTGPPKRHDFGGPVVVALGDRLEGALWPPIVPLPGLERLNQAGGDVDAGLVGSPSVGVQDRELGEGPAGEGAVPDGERAGGLLDDVLGVRGQSCR